MIKALRRDWLVVHTLYDDYKPSYFFDKPDEAEFRMQKIVQKVLALFILQDLNKEATDSETGLASIIVTEKFTEFKDVNLLFKLLNEEHVNKIVLILDKLNSYATIFAYMCRGEAGKSHHLRFGATRQSDKDFVTKIKDLLVSLTEKIPTLREGIKELVDALCKKLETAEIKIPDVMELKAYLERAETGSRVSFSGSIGSMYTTAAPFNVAIRSGASVVSTAKKPPKHDGPGIAVGPRRNVGFNRAPSAASMTTATASGAGDTYNAPK
jgi:hypothetical protein